MDKRNLFKGIAAGTMAIITAGIGGKSVFAAEHDRKMFYIDVGDMPPEQAMKAVADWRDEILSLHTGYEIHNDMDVSYPRGSKSGENRYVKVSTISIYFGETKKWRVLHRYQEWDHFYLQGNNKVVDNHLEGDGTEFDKLEQAFKYAKELKTKYYEQS